MSPHLDWQEIALRLALTVVAGTLVGLDRGRHGRPAGLRTTLLVCLASAVSKIQTNLLLPTTGKPTDSFVTLDLMRLPLGILTGMGFIGAGAILKKGDIVLGVTTATTLWFVTVLGLCFGGGQWILGATARNRSPRAQGDETHRGPVAPGPSGQVDRQGRSRRDDGSHRPVGHRRARHPNRVIRDALR